MPPNRLARDPERELELAEAADRRAMPAETLMEIVKGEQRPNGRYVVLGDMNDTPPASRSSG
jgi:hypothetical protein